MVGCGVVVPLPAAAGSSRAAPVLLPGSCCKPRSWRSGRAAAGEATRSRQHSSAALHGWAGAELAGFVMAAIGKRTFLQSSPLALYMSWVVSAGRCPSANSMSDWHVAVNPRSFTHRCLVTAGWPAWCAFLEPQWQLAASHSVFSLTRRHNGQCIFFDGIFFMDNTPTVTIRQACRLCLTSTPVQGSSVLLAARLVKHKRPQHFTQANAGRSRELHGELGLGDRLTSPRNQGEQMGSSPGYGSV